jgi:hypothetical protein
MTLEPLGIPDAQLRGMHRHPIGPMLLAALGVASAWLWWNGQPIRHQPGVLTENLPIQSDVPPRALPEQNGFRLTAIAHYSIRARVLDTKQYFGAPQARLAPYDVALGWSRMSDQSVLDRMSISMGNRYFFYRWQGRAPIPQSEIIRSAANNHLIPANGAVLSAIRGLRVGQIVDLSGWLVDAEGPDNFTWHSSRRRDDTGNGACELIYVEKVCAWDEPSAVPTTSPVFAVAR